MSAGWCAATMLLLVVSSTVGCNSRPSRIQQVSMNPSAAGKQALEEYDTDGDGYIGGSELENAPGINAALENFDQDGDGRVSAEEVADRVRSWQSERTGMTGILCQVFMDGRPLPGAEVTFEPEAFLGDEIETAVGKTSSDGIVGPLIPKENRPPGTPPGLRVGLYKVKVSRMVGGKETIPSRYNSETILGQEVSGDANRGPRNIVIFRLVSK